MNSFRNYFRAVLVVVFGVLAIVLAASPVLAVDNSGIGGKPAHPRADNPRSQSIFVYELKSGAQISDAVKVINNTAQQKTVLVYAVDSQVSSDGAFACAQKADNPASVGNWIKLSKNSVDLKPGASADVDFTITVPNSASVGEQNGCIVLQDANQTPSKQANGVVLSFRSAIRVAVTIPGKITKQLDFSGPVATRVDKDSINLSVALKNNGNVSLDTDVKANVANVLGVSASSAAGTFPVLARSQATFNFEVSKPFWGGWYSVSASAAYGSDVNKSLGQSSSKKVINSPKKWLFVTPAPAALAIELAALALITGVGIALFMRSRRSKKLHANSSLITIKKGQTLQKIAKENDVSWKVIARLNKLKAPYHLEPGQMLKVPKKASSGGKGVKRIIQK